MVGHRRLLLGIGAYLEFDVTNISLEGTMWYLLAISFGGTLGFLLSAWVHTPIEVAPWSSHEYCDDRFEKMARKYRHEIQTLESEIQHLVHGGELYVEQPVVAPKAANDIAVPIVGATGGRR